MGLVYNHTHNKTKSYIIWNCILFFWGGGGGGGGFVSQEHKATL